MSKVVHLSKAAHERAKHHCQVRGQSMSDWVAGLIAQAIASEGSGPQPPGPLPPPAAPPAPVARPAPAANEPETFAEARALVARPKEAQVRRVPIKKHAAQQQQAALPSRAPSNQSDDEEENYQVFAAPPFWDRAAERGSHGSEMAHQ